MVAEPARSWRSVGGGGRLRALAARSRSLAGASPLPSSEDAGDRCLAAKGRWPPALAANWRGQAGLRLALVLAPGGCCWAGRWRSAAALAAAGCRRWRGGGASGQCRRQAAAGVWCLWCRWAAAGVIGWRPLLGIRVTLSAGVDGGRLLVLMHRLALTAGFAVGGLPGLVGRWRLASASAAGGCSRGCGVGRPSLPSDDRWCWLGWTAVWRGDGDCRRLWHRAATGVDAAVLLSVARVGARLLA